MQVAVPFLASDAGAPAPAARARLPVPWRSEAEVLAGLQPRLAQALHWEEVVALARPWVEAVRCQPAPFWALESLLKEYPLSSAEGLALMRLAESLLRVPDAETAIALTADQLGRADFSVPAGGGHPMLASVSASALSLSKKLLPQEGAGGGLLQRLGARTVVAATGRAVQLLGHQFVLGQTLEEARRHAAAQQGAQPLLRFSYDMLGEAARTEADARRHWAAYAQALRTLAEGGPADRPEDADGISVKLSALYSRYEESQRESVFAVLLPRLWQLCEQAAQANLNLTIDAEESDRLELSLDVLAVLCERTAREHPRWQGLGLAVQAYQTRALEVVQEVVRLARLHRLRLMVRLVKGAYWDSEIKRAQELGLPGYPVFTRKQHTDLAFLACAQALVEAAEPRADGTPAAVFPQFATHNAATIAAVLKMARERGVAFEMQRLHGMGEGIYREVLRHAPGGAAPPLRIYAPVGEHRDLLAYLVRRLLENGANSSFVHQLADEGVTVERLLASPLQPAAGPGLPLPVALYGPGRPNAAGRDLASPVHRGPLLMAARVAEIPRVPEAGSEGIATAMARLQAGFPAWNARPLVERAGVLRRAADLLEARFDAFCGLLVREGRKTLVDAVAEVREAIDFCRYYAQQAETRLAPVRLPGPTGESNELRMRGRGVFVCISPWNFPLAIFAGQVVAALVCGNTVAAKPAEQTPGIAARFVALLHEAGVPAEALVLLHGPGETVGAALVADARNAGVCFTGSTAVARLIHRTLAGRDGPIVPLIAETGGINAMLVDSTALPEQVIDAVVQSAFRSAGQRCSALRLLCVHDSIADSLLEMLAGAMAELRVGDPADFATDIGPVIDAEAHAGLLRQVERLEREARLLARVPLPQGLSGAYLAPVAFEIGDIATVREEIFGPVLQVLRWRGDVEAWVERLNMLGYGLTLGVQTRIDARAERIAALARVGNVYVNRNMIGAVVGVQPFGGEGLSGTGPKAGGPHYLPRFCVEQTLTINTAAAGGNAALLAGGG